MKLKPVIAIYSGQSYIAIQQILDENALIGSLKPDWLRSFTRMIWRHSMTFLDESIDSFDNLMRNRKTLMGDQ